MRRNITRKTLEEIDKSPEIALRSISNWFNEMLFKYDDTCYNINKNTGITYEVLYKLRDGGSIRLETLARLVAYFGECSITIEARENQ